MTIAPVSHSNPKGKEKEKEKEKEQEKNKEKEKVKKKAKEKERKKKKKKKVEVASCDVKQQYPFEGFNIDGEGPTKLMSSFSQWINEGLYKHHAKKRDKDNHYLANCSDLEFKQLDFVFAFPKKKDWFYVMSQPNKCWTDEYVDVILYYLRKKSKQQRFGIPAGLPWHLTDEVYVPINCNGEFHWVLAVVVLKERCIKTYDSMSSSRTNKKLCAEIQKLSTMLPKYLESSGFYEQNDRTNWSVLESYQGKNKSHPFEVIHVTGIAQQTKQYDCGVFVVAYAEFLSDGLQIPSNGIISQSLRLRYASLLWNYGILKAPSGYVSNNEGPQRPRPKKPKFIDENVVIKVVVAIFSTTSVVICCDPLLQQGVVALIISSLSLISCQKYLIFVVVETDTNIMAPVKRKIVLTKETTDTKIQKRPRTRTCRKKNENSTTSLLEELASEAIFSSQVKVEFSQKEYEEREKEKNEVDDDGEIAEEVEEEEGNKKEVEEDKGKQKEVEEEEGKNKEPNATGDSIMRSAMGKSFDTFRITLKQNGLEDFFRNSCFGHFLDLPKNNNARFQMTVNPEKNDEVLINYYGMPLFFGRRDLAIVSGLKCHPPSKLVPEFIDTPRNHNESLCLLWFVHNVLLAKDLNNNISLKWMNLSQDIEAFNNYPWGPKTNNLFGFPWDFMASAFEDIPHLTHQVNAEEEISSPRILRWLRSKPKTAKNIPDLYNPPHDAVRLVETLFDPIVDRVKMELAGARTIKRDRVVNELVVFYGGDGRCIDVGAGAGQDQGATSCRRCSGFLFEKCKKHDEDFIMYLQSLSQTVNEFKNKRGVKAIQNLKKKIFGELPIAIKEEMLEFKHVNVYKRVTVAEKEQTGGPKESKGTTGEDFRTMTSMDIWWEDWYVDEILSLMRERHVRYPKYYDSTDRILDLNFYSNFKLRYANISEEAIIIGAKRLLVVMNLNKTHFVTLDILLHEGRMNVYDCLLMGMEHAKFLTFIQPVFELLPKLLKQSGIMKHFPNKFLNVPWKFKGRLEPMVTDDSKVVCASYSLAFIEHLITRTTIQPPKTLLCDNAVRRMQWVWAAGIVSRSLEP
ncbi:hypothetical protein H5410_006249 [Solanum commersonii]|uniref:Ubiquitin-like protease family profile domain-containing protein n=1 Tax=Solanum commersonii TaxID=4109 RepID=A0A9J6AAR8_SOLCO|nr:hypothetical protein H5410_006249 [Solanum commersonii]